MSNQKVFISTSSFGESDKTPLQALADAHLDVILNPYKRKLTKEESLKLFPGCVGLIAGLETLDEQVLQKTGLKVISRCGAGVSNVDFQAAKRLNITVCSTPDAPTDAVAELTISAMLTLLRDVVPMNHALHQRQWQKKIGSQLGGKTVAIIGFGRIGRRVAELLEPFHVTIVPVDIGVSLSAALPKADIITIHVSGEEQLLGKKEFACMKKGVFILNASRGDVIDEGELVDALKRGAVAGAWCDVFGQEPYQGPLCNFPQVLLTPHVGSYTHECRRLMEMQAAENLIRALKSLDKHAR